ncbi:MAG: SPOR domain-containing protein [Bacteroidota bacterium]
MRKYIIISALILIALSTFCQESVKDNTFIFDRIQENNNIKIHQDFYIKSLVNKNVEINKKFDGMDGYSIRIYSARGANAKKYALDVKSDFMKKYPMINSDMNYIPPNFRVLVGNFRTKTEAEKFRREIMTNYPGAFIVKDVIKFPEL